MFPFNYGTSDVVKNTWSPWPSSVMNTVSINDTSEAKSTMCFIFPMLNEAFFSLPKFTPLNVFMLFFPFDLSILYNLTSRTLKPF